VRRVFTIDAFASVSIAPSDAAESGTKNRVVFDHSDRAANVCDKMEVFVVTDEVARSATHRAISSLRNKRTRFDDSKSGEQFGAAHSTGINSLSKLRATVVSFLWRTTVIDEPSSSQSDGMYHAKGRPLLPLLPSPSIVAVDYPRRQFDVSSPAKKKLLRCNRECCRMALSGLRDSTNKTFR